MFTSPVSFPPHCVSIFFIPGVPRMTPVFEFLLFFAPVRPVCLLSALHATHTDGSTAHEASGRLDACKPPGLTPRLNQSSFACFCVHFAGGLLAFHLFLSGASRCPSISAAACPTTACERVQYFNTRSTTFPVVPRFLPIDLLFGLTSPFRSFPFLSPRSWSSPPDAMRSTASPVECAGFWVASGQDQLAINS